MKDTLARLSERTQTLGNYNRKYLHIISNNINPLTEALEKKGRRDRIHLFSYSMEIHNEMDVVLEVAENDTQKLDFLGCYFALQFLQMNLRMVDITKLELSTHPDRFEVSKRLMLEAGRMFRYLTKSYMERLLDIFFENQRIPEYTMLGVGTRADQDDIDLGIIYRGEGDANVLNKAMGRLSMEMFKKATRLHFHLSEHIGSYSLAATIEEYEEILAKNISDFVIVTEMLGAANILGSYELFEDFRRRITNKFYYSPSAKDHRHHEGYLRGILGEINSLLKGIRQETVMNPKDEGVRPIKSLLSALKLVYGVDKVNAWDIIDGLKVKNPERLSEYENIEQALSFLELFRHLYQIMVVQEDEINLEEPGIEMMVAKIAEITGFEKKGMVSAKDFLLVNYYEHLDKSTKAIEILGGDLVRHLHRISIIKSLISPIVPTQTGYTGNLALDFAKITKFFKGITYWDDFLEELQDENSKLYERYIDSFKALPERLSYKVAQVYVSGIRYELSAVLKFLVILGKRANTNEAKEIFRLISRTFLTELSKLPDISTPMTFVINGYPDTLNKFLAMLSIDNLEIFSKLIKAEPSLQEYQIIHKQLLLLTELHTQSSNFFKRHFFQTLNNYPMFIKHLCDNEKLKEISSGYYSDLTTLPTLKERFEQLGDYYDLEFVRISLMVMGGASSEVTDAEFTEFCDNYTLTLHGYCQQEIRNMLGYSMPTYDLFALYAAGGHAREQGFDDDYDMIAILDSNDKDKIDYCNKIIGKMNSEILKRGILPHHRFVDHFGSYTINLEQLAAYLSAGGTDIFIDQSQLLTSRMLAGSNTLEQKLQQNIIDPFIFSRSREYIDCMINEMRSRHAVDDMDHQDNIKECRGGLRDIEMLLLIYKVKHKARGPLNRKYFDWMIGAEPGFSDKFLYLEQHLNFIKNLRDLYRLKAAAQNIIHKEYLPPVAASMGYGNDVKAAEKLYSEYIARTGEASAVINKLVEAAKI